MAIPAALAAQAPTVRLRPADSQLNAEFTLITAVRELSDGRVLVGDTRPAHLVLADFSTKSVVTVGSVGSGPGEYRSVAALHATAADSTLLSDIQARRWLVLFRSEIVATLPPETRTIQLAPGALLGADRAGNVMSTHRVAGPALGARAANDSVPVVVVNRRTDHVDTVTALLPEPVFISQRATGGTTVMTLMQVPFVAGEQALLFDDGWIATARLEPYRVDWRNPDGRWVRGAPLPYQPVLVTDRERRAFVEREARATGRAALDPAMLPAGPQTIVPIERRALLPAPDGRLVVKRMPTASDTTTIYDLIDRRGALTEQLRLPETDRLIAFGAKHVYVVVTDSDGLQRLRRHPWP